MSCFYCITQALEKIKLNTNDLKKNYYSKHYIFPTVCHLFLGNNFKFKELVFIFWHIICMLLISFEEN